LLLLAAKKNIKAGARRQLLRLHARKDVEVGAQSGTRWLRPSRLPATKQVQVAGLSGTNWR
jgi:hypothetical protein